MVKALKGTEDILPDRVGIWNEIESISREKFSLYGYKEIRTPIIEETSLFIRSVGEDTDIVKKQMYAFKDQGGRDICLRPEETASVVRAYIEHHMDKTEGFVKLFYMGPMFRGERPQAGRLRQFHQIGVEAIGSYSPYMDAEVIILLEDLLKTYNLPRHTIKLNSLGCEKDKARIKEALKKELKYNLNRLCPDCKRRYETNILRVLDCKNPGCVAIVKSLPSPENQLCDSCADDFKKLQELLDEAGVKYEVSPLLVRGLDYYTKAVYEVTAESLGAQDAVAAGGRYDNLISDLGGQKTGSCGFSIGVERIVEALSKTAKDKQEDKREGIFIATLGEAACKEGFELLNILRKAGKMAEIDYQQRSLKAQMRYADKLRVRFVVILGEDELKENAAEVKDMQDGSQKKVALDKLAMELS